jgi:hypothetical protein
MLRDRSTARRSRSTASRPSGSLTAEPPANRPGSAVRNLRKRFRTLLACLTIGLRSFVCQRVVFRAIRRTGFDCPVSPYHGQDGPALSGERRPQPARAMPVQVQLAAPVDADRGPRTCAGHMPRSSPPVCGLGRGLAGGQLRADQAAAPRPAGRRAAARRRTGGPTASARRRPRVVAGLLCPPAGAAAGTVPAHGAADRLGHAAGSRRVRWLRNGSRCLSSSSGLSSATQ